MSSRSVHAALRAVCLLVLLAALTGNPAAAAPPPILHPGVPITPCIILGGCPPSCGDACLKNPPPDPSPGSPPVEILPGFHPPHLYHLP